MSTLQATGADARPDTAAHKALFASAIGYAMDGFDLLIPTRPRSALASARPPSPGGQGYRM